MADCRWESRKPSTPEEYFEYDAEEFLVFLALLIIEGRTPECSLKGRTEGPHCPPAQTAQPLPTKHQCSDKLPQCCQAKKTQSEVVVLWRDKLPIMIEVMLLPDCCYSSEAPGNDLDDPVVQQDALLLERWTLQPVPRQSGDRFIEEKTLLLAVRSYVFFSQLSAWLSASHGLVPRNILYRVSSAEERLLWRFSQPPAEHAFPVPNVSHSVALRVCVQSLPRQPNYPVLTCSVHSSLALQSTRSRDWRHRSAPGTEQLQTQGSPPLFKCTISSRKYLPSEAPPPGKILNQVHSKLSSTPDTDPAEGCQISSDSTEGLKAPAPEDLTRAFKSLYLADLLGTPSLGCRSHPPGHPSSLIGSLLHERQQVITRIAQRLHYCDPLATHIPDTMSESCEAHHLKFPWGSSFLSGPQHGTMEDGRRRWSSPSDTPSKQHSRAKMDAKSRPSTKPATCRKLLLHPPEDSSGTAGATEDSFWLVPDLLWYAYNRCSQSFKEDTSPSAHKSWGDRRLQDCTGKVPFSAITDSPIANSPESSICTELEAKKAKAPHGFGQDPSSRPQDVACVRLEKPTTPADSVPLVSNGLQNAKTGPPDSPDRGQRAGSPDGSVGLQGHMTMTDATVLHQDTVDSKPQTQGILQLNSHEQNENQDQTIPNQRACGQDQQIGPDRTQNGPVLLCDIWNKENRPYIDGTASRAFHPSTGLPLVSSPVPQRRAQAGGFDLDTSMAHCKGLRWSSSRRECLRKQHIGGDSEPRVFSTSAPPASLSLLGNFEECVLNHRLEPLGTVKGFTAEVGASGTFCPSHMTLPVEVSFYSVSDDNAPSPYMGVIKLEPLGKRGYRVPPSGTVQVTLFNPNKTVVKMFVVVYDLRKMPACHQTFLRQRTFSVPIKREPCGHVSRKPLPFLPRPQRTLRYLVHLRFQSSRSGKIYLYRDIRLLFSRKSMEVDSGAAYELKSFTESPAPTSSPRR
nr:protein FAM214A-like isoform X1 [Paramormyrops kingsleyae]